METSQHLSNESFSDSLRLSLDSDSFIEFDPKLISMRWTNKAKGEVSDSSLDLDSLLFRSLSTDSCKSLLPRSNRHQSRCFCNVPIAPASSGSAQGAPKSEVSRRAKLGLAFRKYMRFLLKKVMGLRLVGKKAGSTGKVVSVERGRGKRVFDVDVESSIHDAVLHCKNSNGEFSRDGDVKF